jgi:hypothetical protein
MRIEADGGQAKPPRARLCNIIDDQGASCFYGRSSFHFFGLHTQLSISTLDSRVNFSAIPKV